MSGFHRREQLVIGDPDIIVAESRTGKPIDNDSLSPGTGPTVR
jgi:hypothetical protein